MINLVDEFVIYDKVGYSKNDWRNRNIIKTPNGPIWLTIPVFHPYTNQPVNQVKVSDKNWTKKHWKAFILYYSKAPYFDLYKKEMEHCFLNENFTFLSEINIKFIKAICSILKIKTPLITDYPFASSISPTQRLVEICKSRKADTYLTGPAAKSYLSESLFIKENISLEWMDYKDYPEYNQLYPPFTHQVSILDLLFNTGPEASQYMLSFKNLSKD